MPRRRAWILCTLLFFATALSFLDRQVLSVLAPELTREFGMSNTVYSRVVFAFVLSYTIMCAVGGRLMDALGTRLGLAFAVAVWSIASGAPALANGPWVLGVSRFFLGVGEGACFPAATAGAVEWMPPEQRALAVGFANGGSAFGNTNRRGFFGPDIRGFLKRREGPTHQVARGVGHYAGTRRRIADALGIDSVIVTGER